MKMGLEDFEHTLISIRRLDDEGSTITIPNGTMGVTKNYVHIMKAAERAGLYEFDLDGTAMALLTNDGTSDGKSALQRTHNQTCTAN